MHSKNIRKRHEKGDFDFCSFNSWSGFDYFFSTWFTARYPLSTPATDEFPSDKGLVKIWLSPYPKNGAIAEALLAGRMLNYHMQASEGDYTTFINTDSKTGNVTVARLFRDSDGDAVLFEDPGNWSVAYNLRYGDRASRYQLLASVSKKITDSPILVHKKIAALVQSILKNGPCGVR